MRGALDAIPSGMAQEHEIILPLDDTALEGTLAVPPHAHGLVLFAHGSGSSRKSPRNRAVAAALQAGGLATLLFDLLSADEEALDARTGELRFDVELLAGRLVEATDFVRATPQLARLPLGY